MSNKVAIWGLYEDSSKTTTIVTGNRMVTSPRRKDYIKRGEHRSYNGALKTWEIENTRKYEVRLRLTDVKEVDLDKIEDAYNDHNAMYFFPDINNKPAVYYKVYITNDWDFDKDKFTHRYNGTLELKEE